MATRDIIVVGASAGGIEALQRLCGALPADLDASVFIVQHLSPSARSMLPPLLARVAALPVTSPEDGEAIERGRIYVAAPDHHMLLRAGTILMRRGPRENRTRPALNALFRSAAIHYGGRVIGAVLTGLLDDGTDGLIAIKAAGGCSIAQDPKDAEWPSMPRNAIKRDHVDHIVPVAALPELLARLSREPASPSVPLPETYLIEDRVAAEEFAVGEPDLASPGEPSHLACPDCGGVLNAIESDDDLRFRCQVGHAFTPMGLAAAQSDELERALGIAVRTHRDRIKLYDQMTVGAETNGRKQAGERWVRSRLEAEKLIGVLEDAMATLRRAEG